MEVILEGKAYEITQNEDGTFSLPKELERLRGLGTQLKPSWEPALIARKPIVEKTVAKQVLKTGTGAMNIDACRVSTKDQVNVTMLDGQPWSLPVGGRWPSNLLMTHLTEAYYRPKANLDEAVSDCIFEYFKGMRLLHGSDVRNSVSVESSSVLLGSFRGSPSSGERAFGTETRERTLEIPFSAIPSGWIRYFEVSRIVACKRVGSKKIDAPVINRFTDGMKPFGNGAGHEYTSIKTGDADGKEEIPVYDCEEGCPVDALDQQAGIRKSSGGVLNRAGIGFGGKAKGNQGYAHPSEGTASRFFQNFECEDGCPIKELDEQSGIRAPGASPAKKGLGSAVVYGEAARAGVEKEREQLDGGTASRYFQNFTYECEPGCAVKELDGQGWEYDRISHGHDDEESASRFFGQFQPEAPFFYATKVSKKERNKGLGQPLVQLRKDLTPQERDYVLEQLRAAGVVGVEASHAAIPQE